MPSRTLFTVAGSLAVLALAASLLLSDRSPLRERGPVEASLRVASSGNRGLASPESLSSGAERDSLVPVQEIERIEPISKTPSTAPAGAILRTRVLDTRGAPVPGVAVQVEGEPQDENTLTISDANGDVFLPIGEHNAPSPRLASTLPEFGAYATVRAAVLSRAPGQPTPFLIVAPAVQVAGRAVDALGSPLVGESVSLNTLQLVGGSSTPGFPFPLDSTRRVTYETKTDASGAFTLGRVPSYQGAQVMVRTEAGQVHLVDVPPKDTFDLLLRLEPTPERDTIPVVGWVLLPDGSPAVGASVQFGPERTLANENGRFRLTVPSLPFRKKISARRYGARLAAGLAGYRPILRSGFDEVLRASFPGPPPETTLILDEAREIAGRLVDGLGNGLAGWRVSIAEPTILSRARTPISTAEGLAGYESVWTDATGRFRIRGLDNRSYRVLALHAQTLQCVQSEAQVPSGTEDLLLRTSDSDLLDSLTGRVRFTDGRPAEGIDVELDLVLPESVDEVLTSPGARTSTDADGRFTFHRVPRDGVNLTLKGPTVQKAHFRLGGREGLALQPGRELAFAVEVPCHFRILLQTERPGSYRIAVLDAEGGRLPLSDPFGGDPLWASIDPGRTIMFFSVAESARTLVLYRNRSRVLQRPLDLDPATPTEIHLTFP